MFKDNLNQLIDETLLAERANQAQRKYLGASRLGLECSRALQYEYLGKNANYNGQILKIFEAGHLFEQLIVKWLQAAGIKLLTHNDQGEQFGFEVAGGRIAGHIDGVVIAAPASLALSYPMLFEAKSMKNRSWQETVKKGLVLSKPTYAAQIALYQAYMEATFKGISENPCLFTAINKDTAEIYHELIPFDAELAQVTSDKAVGIIKATEAQELLTRAYNSSNFYSCKMCSYREECWREK